MSLRQVLCKIPANQGSNPGLVLDRFANLTNEPNSRISSFKNAQANLSNLEDLYSIKFKHWEESLKLAKTTICKTDFNRVLIGGNESVFETSIRLHSIFGFPIIPGSALKGVTANYVASIYDKEPGFSQGGEYYNNIFGDTDSQGLVVFHDAWILPEYLSNSLLLDITTVHYTNYYRQNFQQSSIESDNPNPVTFLSVKGAFLLAIEPTIKNEKAYKWAELALELLVEALQEKGIGAKTSAGYGYLYEVKDKNKNVPETKIVQQKEYKSGDVVVVKRVEDPKGKGRPWFSLLDGSLSGRLIVEGIPDVELGTEMELRISSCNMNQRSANFTLK